jgi:hypothetical protein
MQDYVTSHIPPWYNFLFCAKPASNQNKRKQEKGLPNGICNYSGYKTGIGRQQQTTAVDY